LEGRENTNNLGNVTGAQTLYDRAVGVLEPLADRQQGDAKWHDALSVALEGRVAVMRQLRRAPEAMVNLERAAHHARRAAALAPQDLNLRCHECNVLVQLTDHAYPIVRFHGLCQLDAARLHLSEVVQRSLDLVASMPEGLLVQRTRAFVMRVNAGHLAIAGRLQDAVAAELEAFAVLEHAIAAPGGAALRTRDFVQAAIRVAITQRAAGLYEQAAAALAPALVQGEADLQNNVADTHRQRQLVSVSQTLLDVCIHLGREAEAAAVYANARQRLPVLQAQTLADPLSKRPWEHAWMDSLQALCWARTGHLEKAQPLVTQLMLWMQQGHLRLRANPSALDCELEANIHIARTQIAAVTGDWNEAESAAEAALDRLRAMQALRDPRDAVEAVRSWQLQVRLAQSVTGDAAAALALRTALVDGARSQQQTLVERGWVEPTQRREALWLAGQV
jgi:eukaryotic-like serine/threonine-protein kinase